MNLPRYTIYTDASFDQSSGTGVAGALFIDDKNGVTTIQSAPHVNTKLFHKTTCSRLEIEAIIWALTTLKKKQEPFSIKLYTDCKTAVDLPHRRHRLEQRNFHSKRTGLALNNSDLYIQFFALMDDLVPEIVFIPGHQPKEQQDISAQLFALVDKTTRKTLREIKRQSLQLCDRT